MAASGSGALRRCPIWSGWEEGQVSRNLPLCLPSRSKYKRGGGGVKTLKLSEQAALGGQSQLLQ